MTGLTFFLGANSCSGFYSLYEKYMRNAAPAQVWILKGGAGCGKSGFLKKVAQQADASGYSVRRILCSGDPKSLDGIHIEELNTLLFDGTAPHVLEPPLTGYSGFYLDLSRFYGPGVPDLSLPDAAYKEHYRRAYHWLSASCSVGSALALEEETRESIRRKAASLISRELRRQNRRPRIPDCFFTDAFTGDGPVSLPETRRMLAPRLISLQGVCGAEACFLSAAAESASARGWDTVICPDPLAPQNIAHLLIPEAGLGLTTGEGDRRIHLDHLVCSALDKDEVLRIRETETARFALLAKAKKELQLAKYHHDRLEEAVNPYVDFEGVYRFAEVFARKLLRDKADDLADA